MEAEYDQLAEEYDSTREVPTDLEVGAVAGSMEGGKAILDVGVGTGRFAKPLSGLGFEVTGVDVSRRMLSKAREKGIERLVVGDAYRLPFVDKSFDSAMIIHVLHVVADWASVMREIGRVTKGNVVTILRVPQRPASPVAQGGGPTPAVATTAGGYPIRTQHRMWENEEQLKERVPPVRLERIRDETLQIPIAEAFKRLEAKRSVGMQMVPPEMRRAMVDRIIAMRGDQFVQRRIVEDLAVWRAEQLEGLPK